MKKVTGSNLKSSAMSILTVYLGLVLGVFTLQKVPSHLAKYVAAAVGLGGPFFVKNKDLQILFATVGAAGVSKIIKDLTAGKTGVLSMVNSSTPTLAGTGGMGYAGSLGRLGNVHTGEMLSLGEVDVDPQINMGDSLSLN